MDGYIAYAVFFVTIASIYALICLGLNLQWGSTGLFNVGVAGFFAVGAYATAILTGPDYPGQVGGFSLPVPVGWLGALIAGGAAAHLRPNKWPRQCRPTRSDGRAVLGGAAAGVRLQRHRIPDLCPDGLAAA